MWFLESTISFLCGKYATSLIWGVVWHCQPACCPSWKPCGPQKNLITHATWNLKNTLGTASKSNFQGTFIPRNLPQNNLPRQCHHSTYALFLMLESFSARLVKTEMLLGLRREDNGLTTIPPCTMPNDGLKFGRQKRPKDVNSTSTQMACLFLNH